MATNFPFANPYRKRVANRQRQWMAPQPDRDFADAAKPRTLATQQLSYNSYGQPSGTLGNRPRALETLFGPATKPPLLMDQPSSIPTGRQRGWGGQQPTPPVNAPSQAPQSPSKPPGAANGRGSGLWLTPEGEAMRRALDDQLSAELASIGVARQEIPAMVALMTERMKTNETEDLRRTDESMNSRGLYNSGIRGVDRGKVNLGYDRQRQDLAGEMANQYRGLAGRESAARMDYQRGLAEALMQLAQLAIDRGDVVSGGKGGGKGTGSGGRSSTPGTGPVLGGNRGNKPGWGGSKKPSSKKAKASKKRKKRR